MTFPIWVGVLVSIVWIGIQIYAQTKREEKKEDDYRKSKESNIKSNVPPIETPLISSSESKEQQVPALLFRFDECREILYLLINNQLTAPYYYVKPGRLYPLLCFAVFDYYYKYGNKNNQKLVEVFNKKYLKSMDEKHPQKVLGFFNSSRTYLKEYFEYVDIHTQHPQDYRQIIEKSLDTSADTDMAFNQYLSDGTLGYSPDKTFESVGLLTELEWICDQIQNYKNKFVILDTYEPIREQIKYDGYPHALLDN